MKIEDKQKPFEDMFASCQMEFKPNRVSERQQRVNWYFEKNKKDTNHPFHSVASQIQENNHVRPKMTPLGALPPPRHSMGQTTRQKIYRLPSDTRGHSTTEKKKWKDSEDPSGTMHG